MTFHAKMMRCTALVSAAIVPLLVVPASAQTAQQTDEGAITQEEATTIAVGQPDGVVARVGAVDIRRSDVMTQIGMLPERVRAQPPELLIPMAVEQLVLRQLILQEASTQELATDPQVQILTEEAAQAARNNVLVQVWLERELGERVTDEAVQAAYDALQATSEAELPPLDQVRGQVEQSLQQQEIGVLTQELLGSDLVVFYGPDGQPMEAIEADAAGTATGGAAGDSGAGADTGTDEAADDAAGETESTDSN